MEQTEQQKYEAAMQKMVEEFMASMSKEELQKLEEQYNALVEKSKQQTDGE